MFRWFRGNVRGATTREEILPTEITADGFCSQLWSVAPSLDQLLGEGMTSEGAEQLRAMYRCSRENQGDISDALIDLCSNFDVSTIEIGTVTFCRPQQFEDVDYWVIGYDEADPIVYPKSGGAVSIRDHGRLDYQISQCARTGEGFLSALLAVAEFNASYPDDAECIDDREAMGRDALFRCLAFAGRESESYYRTLLNVWG